MALKLISQGCFSFILIIIFIEEKLIAGGGGGGGVFPSFFPPCPYLSTPCCGYVSTPGSDCAFYIYHIL